MCVRFYTCICVSGWEGVYPGKRMCFCVRESCITSCQLHNLSLGNSPITCVSVLGTDRDDMLNKCLTRPLGCMHLKRDLSDVAIPGHALHGALTRMKEPSCLHLCTHQLFLSPYFTSANLHLHPRDAEILDLG